jgi:hypothetical protein
LQKTTTLDIDPSPPPASEPGWHIMPIAYHIGIPLAFRTSKSTEDTDINDTATYLSINVDFERNDDDIATNGFDTTAKGAVYGAVDIMRLDGKDLRSEDIDALSDYVEINMPYTRRLRLGNQTVARVHIAREEWRDYGSPERFAANWHCWRHEAIRSGHDEYKELQCPVVLTPMPSVTEAMTTGIQALQDIVDG